MNLHVNGTQFFFLHILFNILRRKVQWPSDGTILQFKEQFITFFSIEKSNKLNVYIFESHWKYFKSFSISRGDTNLVLFLHKINIWILISSDLSDFFWFGIYQVELNANYCVLIILWVPLFKKKNENDRLQVIKYQFKCCYCCNMCK